MKTPSQRLRRLIRKLIKDKSWIEITNWEWYDFHGNQHLENNTSIVPLCADYCWYRMNRISNSHVHHKTFDEYEIIRKIVIGGGDCLCYNLYIGDNFKLIKLDGECTYILTDGKHNIMIKRLSYQECVDKNLNME